MEADWNELVTAQLSPPGSHPPAVPISTFAFDTTQELLWTGNNQGRVTSLYGPSLERYTSYRGHATSDGPVKQFLFTDKGVLSISRQSVHYSHRRGLTQWHLTSPDFKDLKCMNFTSKGTREILIAGCQEQMFKVDVEKGIVVDTLPVDAQYTIMKRAGQYLCAATKTGGIHILDSNSLSVIKVFEGHTGSISDMDAKGDFLATCGWSPRQQYAYMLDPFTNVFSLKTLKQLAPVPFHTGAAFVRMHPRMSTTAIIASQNGQMQVIDLMNPDSANLRQLNLYDSYLAGFEMAPSGEAFALADSNSNVHLWGSPAKVHFPEYSNPTEFADHVIPPASMDWSLDTPLNTIGMPYYKETLLSGWPSHMVFEVGAPPPKIDGAILSNMTRTDMGFFAKNPRTKRRNQIEVTRQTDRSSDSLTPPKFLSEKSRASLSLSEANAKAVETMETLTDLHLDDVTRKDVPAMYGNVEIKYSKFGVDDFDFAYYNQTPFSGLETHITNSYANSLLQLFRFTPLIRNLALQHTASPCLFESCLLCELGFLIDMLEKAAGLNCQASNFLKTFSGLSNAVSLNLLEEFAPNVALTSMIQNLNRFLLDKISEEFRQMLPSHGGTSLMDQVLETQARASMRCAQCANETIRGGKNFVNELVYPAKHVMKNTRIPRPTFSQILKASVERQDQTRGWCTKCNRYQQMVQRKTIQSVPGVLMLNAAIQTHEAKLLWSIPNWLPHEIGIIVDQGQFYCFEGQDLKLHLQRGVFDIMVYELVGVVADINSGEHQKPHLVATINTGPSSREPDAEDKWHLFNDFLVRPIPREEALRFEPSWKLPSVLTFQTKSARNKIDDSWKENLDTSILYRWWSSNPTPPDDKFKLLQVSTEAPRPGYPVAIDAEFIRLQAEEIEMKADGTRQTIRPDRKGLARVSVCRGEGEHAGLPFIDDYIAVTEQVVDYLTEWSGISPGDLNRETSPHAPVSLKHAYKKLWLLLNLGCVFVGHSLANDFRTINIHVPRSQVVDTSNLFFLPDFKRKLNLKFLAWCVLKEQIQQDTHDSIEDATTALKLWRKYEEFVDAGVLEPMLNDIYATGSQVKFKAPGSGNRNSMPAGMTATGAGRDTPEPMTTPKKGGAFGGVGFRSPMRR
ncbi:PAN2-PAN3 deadenylation complex catalytic subunit PAN2 [Parastagonospora nodorum]|uniref:PAN2-PAN3 deadenylation complex catalytic subunit PAN2 n=3 Tax=Phaeosphaeria nodorum (strain SN15 / ATCC MYA-4574 / FGSC 10173) TaxID=321614 RepID=PAN2_PHANO|nr:RecName: Full=PAN2-PAN3 deadenylation complex catalytic subunit PAN2; AltName: Full=PAB1P-dependent poly(A)-specific ribonuclease; AltName: Full=Poly(A)-nuclease deadenylation complex subunit 2; Short=PAN deadenylation complex subunit 2 [Parastagonospora nodorum SN15]KAH3918911.1 PAN2-PAN3 deadenylation complex catalytic subunit PAN2 [Parastagonospora nodorum]KAH3934284.1 PAN2-PAN3 deadenylation complex catalytic subunit PAN2 [Parastagonospora nodorum]KAH3949922.1 PAN2-PAN3 deadenylation comp